MLQHPHQMGLAAAIKAADPDGRLLALAELRQVVLENALQPLIILPFADKGAQFIAQHIPLLGRFGKGYCGDPIIGNREGRWVALEQLSVFHL